jgi:hypothetical protein
MGAFPTVIRVWARGSWQSYSLLVPIIIPAKPLVVRG